MKRKKYGSEPGDWEVLWMLAIVVFFAVFAVSMAYAGGYGNSWSGTRNPIGVSHYLPVDSMKAIFGYPSKNFMYDTVRLYPDSSGDSSVAHSDSLLLDSFGTHFVQLLIWEVGETDTVIDSALWTHMEWHPQKTMPGGIGSGTLCAVFGFLYDRSNTPVVGAVISAVGAGSGIGVDTSGGSSTILASIPVEVSTDTLGAFNISLRRTGDYTDTSKGFYRLTATYNGEEIFLLNRFYIPDVASLDLGDTLYGRGL